MNAYKYLKSKININPAIGIILGSGLGGLADSITDCKIIKYSEIPNFPVSTVEGHEGKFICGKINGKSVLIMKGRIHYYEGYDIKDVVFPIIVMSLWGIKELIVTNAAGAINTDFSPGDFMIIKDHISFFMPSLFIETKAGPDERFIDMSNPYDKQLIAKAKSASIKQNIDLKEGIYAYMRGPLYETPAEIRALGIMGADAVGMSTVPEVVTARQSGMSVLGISCITNMASGIEKSNLGHKDVINTAQKHADKFSNILYNIIDKM